MAKVITFTPPDLSDLFEIASESGYSDARGPSYRQTSMGIDRPIGRISTDVLNPDYVFATRMRNYLNERYHV